MKRNGTWDIRQRQAEKELQDRLLRQHLCEELRPIVRRELTREFIQSGLVRINSVDQVNALIAERNEWRGNRLLDELARDFAAVGNAEAAAAIREWQRLARQASGQKRSASSQEPPDRIPRLTSS